LSFSERASQAKESKKAKKADQSRFVDDVSFDDIYGGGDSGGEATFVQHHPQQQQQQQPETAHYQIWVEHWDESQQSQYYINQSTHESRWEPPSHWRQHLDVSGSGACYFVNAMSNETVWELPGNVSDLVMDRESGVDDIYGGSSEEGVGEDKSFTVHNPSFGCTKKQKNQAITPRETKENQRSRVLSTEQQANIAASVFAAVDSDNSGDISPLER
jgi:hypothetical protein